MAATDRRTSAVAERHRVDRWLWFARFFKSRSLAAAAVTGGRVHVNGARVKPARGCGRRGSPSRRAPDVVTIVVRALPSRRGPAAEAAACFEETDESRTRREAARLRPPPPARELHVAPPSRARQARAARDPAAARPGSRMSGQAGDAAAILTSRPARLFIALAGLFVTNALIAEFVGVKIFALEDTLGIAPFDWRLFGQSRARCRSPPA